MTFSDWEVQEGWEWSTSFMQSNTSNQFVVADAAASEAC